VLKKVRGYKMAFSCNDVAFSQITSHQPLPLITAIAPKVFLSRFWILIRPREMKHAAAIIFISAAFASQVLAVLRPLFPAKAAPPFNRELIVIRKTRSSILPKCPRPRQGKACIQPQRRSRLACLAGGVFTSVSSFRSLQHDLLLSKQTGERVESANRTHQRINLIFPDMGTR
jgi:hypothetical protein